MMRFHFGRKRRKIGGLVLLVFGTGMALGLALNAWAFVVAASIVIIGFWMLFL